MKNRKARFNYELIETYQAGIVLIGTEVRAMREGGCAFNDAYCYINNNELFLKNFHIAVENPLRERKLLLHRKELDKLQKKIKEKGLTIVPTSIFFNETGLIKVKIALAKGKKNYDKRETIKKRDLDRELKNS